MECTESESIRPISPISTVNENVKLVNPFTEARTNRRLQKVEVAKLIDTTAQYVSRVELAMFASIPKRIVSIYLNELDLNPNWQSDYERFRSVNRKLATRPKWERVRWPEAPVTFSRFRGLNWPTLSQIAWCREFRVHPSTIYALESAGQFRVTDDIKQALTESQVMNHAEFKELIGLIERDR